MYTNTTGVRRSRFTNGSRRREKSFRRQQPQMETCHQMCRTRDRTADRARGIKQREFALLSECAVQTRSIALLSECAVQTRSIALLPECAEYRTSLSARINQKTRLVVGTDKDLALLRVRGEGQHNTIRGVTLDEDGHEYRTAHVRGMTSTPQCAM